MALPVIPVKKHLVLSDRAGLRSQLPYLPPKNVVNRQLNVRRFTQRETDRRPRIERIGIILMQNKYRGQTSIVNLPDVQRPGDYELLLANVWLAE